MNINKVANKPSLIILIFFISILFSNCRDKNNTKETRSSELLRDSTKEDKTLPGSKQKDVVQDTRERAESSTPIVGTYIVINEGGASDKCPMTLTISQAAEGYKYKLETESRSLTGKLLVQATQEKNTLNISLEGIRWSEYEGELGDDGEPKVKGALELPVGIDGILQDNQISIQNSGNSMNYYVKLEECGRKYIVLKKQ